MKAMFLKFIFGNRIGLAIVVTESTTEGNRKASEIMMHRFTRNEIGRESNFLLTFQKACNSAGFKPFGFVAAAKPAKIHLFSRFNEDGVVLYRNGCIIAGFSLQFLF
ncbi:hypothetical protein [Paenibacillus sp. J2TS4]|uniref:hypothetical protein n=1 Tax=Paenibacillus sp. J2TS4 TaxID=2807194 RepID=UPI001B0AE897|nr:hypothetical protein [Paenibacillus sp. J2TS4]GIP34205.1 hypothetical protein J2TS4_34150 [Paenibacillus sp. J2TS4]